MVTLILVILSVVPPVKELKSISSLPKLTIPWSPDDELWVEGQPQLTELTRILGAITVNVEGKKEQTAIALKIAEKTKAKLGVLLRPWFPVVTDPGGEFQITWNQWRTAIAPALRESIYKPEIICLIDAEILGNAELFSIYDAFITALGCKRREWYNFASTPNASEMGWGTQQWSVKFDGLQTMGFEIYHQNEQYLRREISRKAKVQAIEWGILDTTAWVSIGCGRVFDWKPFTTWTDNTPQSLDYTIAMSKELYEKWYCDRPTRYMSCPSTIIIYPHPFDKRTTKWEHLIAFLKRN